MKILYVANVYRHITSFHMPYLKWLKEEGFEVHVAGSGDESIPKWIQVPYVDKNFDISIRRSPYSFQNIKAYRQLKEIVESEKYDIVHCHTPMGGVIGRLASRGLRKNGTKVIYTAHGFHFCKGAPKINWLIYYPVERFMARYTDVLITMNKEDADIARNFKCKERYSIPGIGFDIAKFKNVEVDMAKKREELGILEEEFAIISVGDLTKRKNHQSVIKAISKLDSSNIKYIICGKGVLEHELKQLCLENKLSEKVIFLEYRTDINEILKSSDVFVFPSLHEGLAIAGLEAMAAGVPVVASNRRGVSDYCIDEKTALLCEPMDSECIARSIIRIRDEEGLAERLTEEAFKAIEKFDISNAMGEMQKIYKKVAPELFEERKEEGN